MTRLYTDPLFLLHDTGPHPETADRLRAITARLAKTGLDVQCSHGTFQPLTVDAVRQLHAARQVEQVRETAAHAEGPEHLPGDADTMVCPESFQVGLAAAGACAAAVDAVLAGPERTALCLVRPPGHHATPTRSMGFCLFNNIALAAHHARKSHSLTRILIVDWDVHHGNGTQDIFYADPEVMFLSIHRYGMHFYPGTGAADETGTGPGLGYTLNVPVPWNVTRAEFRDRFTRGLEKAADKIRPELVLVSAGFDAHVRDPLGQLCLEAEDYATLTRQVLDVAGVHAAGRVVSCLEGGYNLGALSESVQAHLEELIASR